MLVLRIVFYNLLLLFVSFRKKTVLCSFRFPYFYDIAKPILESIPSDFLIIVSCKEGVDNENNYFFVPYDVSSYLFLVDVFISVETSGINFPHRLINCIKVMAFHGLGTYNLSAVSYHLEKFDYFFAPNAYFVHELQGYKGHILKIGYPKLDSLIDVSNDLFCSNDLVYIPHWSGLSSIYNNVKDIIDKSIGFNGKFIVLHQYLSNEPDLEAKTYHAIEQLKKEGFSLINNISVNEILVSKASILSDIHSSTYLESKILKPDKTYFTDSFVGSNCLISLIRENVNDLEFVYNFKCSKKKVEHFFRNLL